MTTRDRRSVGELLLACDRDTRALLLDPHDLDAAPLVRAWPELVQAAHDLLTILDTSPSALRSSGGGTAGLNGERLRMISDSTHTHLAQKSWPGAGPADPRLLAVADAMIRAHDLIHRTWRTPAPDRPDVHADAAAARTRVLHAVYVATHAVGLALHREIRDRRTRPTTRSRHATQRLAALRYARSRLEVAERIAGTELYRTFPYALAGEHRDPPELDRVGVALAGWHVQAHRALAQQPSLATLFEITRVQAAATAMTRAVLAVAAERGDLDRAAFSAQADNQLAATAAAWHTLHADLRHLTPAAARTVTDELSRAGTELVASLTDIVIDGTTLASPGVVSTRATGQTVNALTDSLASNLDLATTTLEALSHPDVTVSARAAQTYLNARPGPTVTDSPLRAWIDPQDLATDHAIPPPGPVGAALTRHATGLRDVAATLAAAPLGRPCRMTTESAGERTAVSPQTPHRTVPIAPVATVSI